jgi:pimeloyl-ACP methyl ester carboxylesterase
VPEVIIDETLTMYYESDCFVEPWREPETILLVHGVGGATEEWYAWVPPLAGRYRLIRVDLRGWGGSSTPPEGYEWSMDNYACDLVKFLDRVDVRQVHFVGTKLGGRIGLHFARNYPERLHTLTLVCTPMTIKFGESDHGQRLPKAAGGPTELERWARSTMAERLGEVPAEMAEWWIDLYAKCSPRVMSEVLKMAWLAEEYSLLPEIRVPTLVVDSNAEMEIAKIREWQSIIPDSEFTEITLTTEGRQISASKPTDCVAALLRYLQAR